MAIGMRPQKRGLFGSRPDYATPGIGDGMNVAMAMPGMAAPSPMPEQRAPGIGTRLLGEGWEDKAFPIGGLLAGHGGAAAMAMRQQENAQQQAMAQQAEAMRKRSLDMQDWQAKEQWKLENRPEANPTAMQSNYEYLLRTNPKLAEQYLQNQTTAPPMVVDNGDGTKTVYPAGMIPQAGQQQAPSKPVGGLMPMGGPTQPASGGFR